MTPFDGILTTFIFYYQETRHAWNIDKKLKENEAWINFYQIDYSLSYQGATTPVSFPEKWHRI